MRLTLQLRERSSASTKRSLPSAQPRPGASSSVAARSAAPVVAAASSTPPATVILQVEGMVCSKCTDRVENALMLMAGVKDARADLTSGEVKVEVASEAGTSAAALAAAVEELGFGAVVA